MNINIFSAVAELAISAKKRERADYAEFLGFYKRLVETLPTEAVELFGNMAVKTLVAKKEDSAGIELTATDYIWWKENIEQLGVRFVSGTAKVKIAMLNRLSKEAEAQKLEPAERKKLIALLEQAQA